jgi:hypothetical protein
MGMIIHFTEKLRKKLHMPELDVTDVAVGPHLRWYAHVFTAQRVQYILTTNAASLFSVVIFGRGITDDSDYILRFLSELRDHCDDLGLRLVYERVIAPHTGRITVTKTSDRSVLGSINDMVRLCKGRLGLDDASPWDLSQELNTTPFGAIKYGFPKKEFARLPLEEGEVR